MPHYPRHRAPRNGNGGGLWKDIRGLLEPETGRGTAALVGASLVPGVGEAIDVADFAAGLQDRDPARMAWATGGLLLPFVAGSTLRKVLGRGAKAADEFPMDEASRMGRAESQGFDVDTPQYTGFATGEGHGKYFRPGDPVEELAPDTWFSDIPEIADEYAHGPSSPRGEIGPGGQMVKAFTRGNMADLRNPSHELLQELHKRLRGSIPNVDDFGGDEFSALETHLTAGRLWDVEELGTRTFEGRVLEELKDMGFDGVRLPDTTFGRPNVSTVIFDPKNTRSPWAAFDPAQAESANLLAGGAGLLGAGLARRQQERE